MCNLDTYLINFIVTLPKQNTAISTTFKGFQLEYRLNDGKRERERDSNRSRGLISPTEKWTQVKHLILISIFSSINRVHLQRFPQLETREITCG